MTIIRAGNGLRMMKIQTWVDGENEEVCELSLDGIQDVSQYSMPFMSGMEQNIGNPGDFLTIGEDGQASWINPIEAITDKELRKEYPALEQAWGILMEALSEYQMVKKLVQDHDR